MTKTLFSLGACGEFSTIDLRLVWLDDFDLVRNCTKAILTFVPSEERIELAKEVVLELLAFILASFIIKRALL